MMIKYSMATIPIRETIRSIVSIVSITILQCLTEKAGKRNHEEEERCEKGSSRAITSSAFFSKMRQCLYISARAIRSRNSAIAASCFSLNSPRLASNSARSISSCVVHRINEIDHLLKCQTLKKIQSIC